MNDHQGPQADHRGSPERDGEVLAPRARRPPALSAGANGSGCARNGFAPRHRRPAFSLPARADSHLPGQAGGGSQARPTERVLGGYYKSRRLVRVYSHDRVDGPRPLEEVFETFLHEVAHHLEYTEPQSFGSRGCRRAYGLMHSRLFWRIFGELKWRWAKLQTDRPR